MEYNCSSPVQRHKSKHGVIPSFLSSTYLEYICIYIYIYIYNGNIYESNFTHTHISLCVCVCTIHRTMLMIKSSCWGSSSYTSHKHNTGEIIVNGWLCLLLETRLVRGLRQRRFLYLRAVSALVTPFNRKLQQCIIVKG